MIDNNYHSYYTYLYSVYRAVVSAFIATERLNDASDFVRSIEKNPKDTSENIEV